MNFGSFKQYMSDFNLFSFSILSGLLSLMLINEGHRWQVPLSILCFCWGFYFLSKFRVFQSAGIKRNLTNIRNLVEKNVHLLLFAFILAHLLWSGFVIFLNPYEWGYNHGDAIFFNQTLWNLNHGFNPETSYFTYSGAVPPGEDPRLINSNGYSFLYSIHHSWLPSLIFTPLYAIYPYPPMHIFCQILVIIIVGLPGMFCALRALGGSKLLALVGTVGYAILPQTEVILFFKGYFEAMALAVFPWLFAALFSKKWWGFYLASFCLSAISYPFTYTVMFIGVVSVIFFNAHFPGTVAFLIGLTVMKFDSNVYVASVLPYYKDIGAIPSNLKFYVLDRTIGSLIFPFQFHAWYVVWLLQSGAFLAPFAIRRNKKWNFQVIGLFSIAGLCFILMLFRNAGWAAARNANFIVPLYLCSFLAFIEITATATGSSCQSKNTSIQFDATSCLITSMILTSLWGGGFKFPPYFSHYPFGSNAKLYITEFTKNRRVALSKLEQYLPKNATLAFLSEGPMDAVIANRQHVWAIGREPDGVKYYLFFGVPGTEAESSEWATRIDKTKKNNSFKLIYEDTVTPVLLFENLKARPITRNEANIGWDVLRRVFNVVSK